MYVGYQSGLFDSQNDRYNCVCTTHTYGNNDNVITILVEQSTISKVCHCLNLRNLTYDLDLVLLE